MAFPIRAFPINRTIKARAGVAAISLAAALVAQPAQAEFPGALWSMAKVEIDASAVAPDARSVATAALREGLRQANETYFYGDAPVRMQAVIAADGLTADVFVFDALTGALLTETGGLSLDGGADGFSRQALNWMDGLECGTVACEAGSDVQTATTSQTAATSARVAPSTPRAATASVGAQPVGESSQTLASAANAIPVPEARPIAIARLGNPAGGLVTTVVSRGPDARSPLVDAASWPAFDISRVRDFSYAETDRLVFPDALLPSARPDFSASRRADGSPSNIFEFIYDSIASLFESSDDTAVAATEPASTETASLAPNAVTPVPAEPSPTWDAASQQPSNEIRAGRRYAADTLFSNPAGDGDASATGAADLDENGTLTFANPGTSEPAVYENRRPRVRVVAADAATAQAVVTTPAQPTALTVRLDPALYAGQSLAFARRLLGGGDSAVAGDATTGATTAIGEGSSIDTALAARGLSKDADKYSAVETVYYEAVATSPGFWIELPSAKPDLRYAMLSNNAATVVALVRPGSGRIRISDAVAKALSLPTDAWSAISIVALRENDAVVENASGQVFRSSRIARLSAPH